MSAFERARVTLRSALSSVGNLVIAALFVAVVVVAVWSAGVWGLSWFDRVDYEAEPSAIPDVIEKVAGCSPCQVEGIEIEGHRMWFVASDGEGRVWRYSMRDRYRDDVELQNWKDARESEARSFDPRGDLDIALQVARIREISGVEPPKNVHAKRITIDRFFGVGQPVCVQLQGHYRAVDDGGACRR